MLKRRNFLELGVLGLITGACKRALTANNQVVEPVKNSPIVISTWDAGLSANEGAWKILSKNGKALDAVEAGVMVTESEVDNCCVGLNGMPDRDGHTTLDACIMDEKGNAGSVCALEYIEHPVSVARRVMEKTPHVILVGEGALQFALQEGFKKTGLEMSEKKKKAWEDWKKEKNYKPIINIENHDTIGMIAMDANGDLSGSCTTSGMAWKMRGRVGDSPIIGAGLFVDNEIGAAVATGHGEFVIKTCGSHSVIELMRQGYSPTQACKVAVERIVKKYKNDIPNIQVCLIAINKKGEHGGYSIHKGFTYALKTKDITKLITPEYYVK